MRFLPYLQVSLLLGLLAYLLLITLENPGLLHFPLPFGHGEWLVSNGVGVILAVMVGSFYSAALLLPALWHEKWLLHQERRGYKQLESQLAATLQARISAIPQAPVAELPVKAIGEKGTGQESL